VAQLQQEAASSHPTAQQQEEEGGGEEGLGVEGGRVPLGGADLFSDDAFFGALLGGRFGCNCYWDRFCGDLRALQPGYTLRS